MNRNELHANCLQYAGERTRREFAPFGGFHQRLLIRRGGVVLHLGEAVSVGERVAKAIGLIQIVADLHRVAQRDCFQEQLLLTDLGVQTDTRDKANT